MIVDTFQIIISWLTPEERISTFLSKEFRPSPEQRRKDLFELARRKLHFLGFELRVCTALGCTRWRAPWSLSTACLSCLWDVCEKLNIDRDTWNALHERPPRIQVKQTSFRREGTKDAFR